MSNGTRREEILEDTLHNKSTEKSVLTYVKIPHAYLKPDLVSVLGAKFSSVGNRFNLLTLDQIFATSIELGGWYDLSYSAQTSSRYSVHFASSLFLPWLRT